MTFQRGHARPQGSGRKRGQGNKLTDEVKKLAQEHSENAIKRLSEIMAQNDDLRAAALAANSMLDRAYGKPQGSPQDAADTKIKIVITGDDAKL
jgi:hypothetical protein